MHEYAYCSLNRAQNSYLWGEYKNMEHKIRQQEIITILKTANRAVPVKELCNTLFASESSIRRDLQKLEKQGLIKRSYGNAELAVNFSSIVTFNHRTQQNVPAKKEIAIKAASLIQDGNIIFLDQSSTSLYLANEIASRRGITVVTNNTEIMICLANSKLKVVSCGGYLSADNRNCLIGDDARQSFENFYADIAFFSTKSISSDGIISDCSREEVAIRNTMFKQASKKVFLCDSTKFDTLSPCKQCNLEDVDYFVSEGTTSEHFASLCKDTIFL